MRRGGTISFSFPPFAGWVKRIIITCTAIYLFQLILEGVFHVSFRPAEDLFALIPAFVMRGEIWQLVTYSLLH
jgi:membrane associated rhomboid family serine protease